MSVQIDKDYIFEVIEGLMSIDSPSSYCRKAIEYVGEIAVELGHEFRITNKGCGVITVRGTEDEKRVGLAAHTDTLGLMVRSIAGDGTINFTKIGGPILPTLDGEYCRIHTRSGKIYTGTILSKSPSVHVFADNSTRPRDEGNMYVRLDEVVKSADDVKKLGICVGDIIAYDPKTVITESGFVKSRFLDDKASVACILAALKTMKDLGQKPRFDTEIYITVYEEVGHGGAPMGEGLDEMLAVDMGCIGLDLSCTEYDVSICAKDGGGPYDYEMVSRLKNYAEENELDYAVDIYPFYGSDVGAMLRAGHDVRGALIGPGIHASHGMERTHINALIQTVKLIMLYLEAK